MTASVDAAYASCERIARSHYENFPVASILLPRPMRRHVAAIYAFARAADDFADEGDLAADDRLRLLDAWEERLHLAVTGAPQPPPRTGESGEAPAIFAAVAHTLRECDLPPALLSDLISAFRQDVTVTRYPDWETLFDYARRSANPVGRLVLRIAGHRADRLDGWSDAVCTALQFANLWQDFDVDLRRGRIYLPTGELDAEGVAEADLTPGTLPPPVARALGRAVGVTRELFVAGRPLCDELRGRLRYELRATWLGGMRILDRVEQQLDTSALVRPRLQLQDTPWLAWRMVAWPVTPPRGRIRR